MVEAAKRIDTCMREVDTIARVGGDEFVIVLQDVTSEAAVESVAGKIIAALGRPFLVLGWEWTIGGSIGIAIYPRNGVDLETLNSKRRYRPLQS